MFRAQIDVSGAMPSLRAGGGRRAKRRHDPADLRRLRRAQAQSWAPRSTRRATGFLVFGHGWRPRGRRLGAQVGRWKNPLNSPLPRLSHEGGFSLT